MRCLHIEKTETYYLAPAVIAGNVYAKNDMVKNPVYLFQIAASKQKHVIFRTFVSPSGNQSSVDNNSALFEEVQLHIIKKEATVLKNYDDIEFHFLNHSAMTACICYETGQNLQVEIEFPIKHINIQREKRLYQVETGPILIPFGPPSEMLSKARVQDHFHVAFVHFNRSDFAEITTHTPTCTGQELKCFIPQIKKLDVNIILMADHENNEQ